MKVKTRYILLVIGLIALATIWSMLTQPGVNDLAGDFKEVAASQNENNTGPVNRVYIVTLSDTLWTEMETYGNYMPYAKLGTTTVWFFKSDGPFPTQITAGEVPFAANYRQACIGRYQKNNMGAVRLTKYPFQ